MPEANRRAERLAAGLCGACGREPHETGKTRCKACADAAAEGARERRAHAAKHGLCEACLRRKRAKGRGNRCAECADKYLPAQLARDAARRAAKRLSPGGRQNLSASTPICDTSRSARCSAASRSWRSRRSASLSSGGRTRAGHVAMRIRA